MSTYQRLNRCAEAGCAAMRMGFGFGTYMPVTIGTFGQITTIGPRVENENGRAFAPAHLPVTLPLLITSYDSARLSSFCVARLQSVRLRASRRLQGLHQHRSWAHPICPMHECHAQHHRRHPDPLCDHLRLLSGCEMTGGIIPCSDDAPVRSPCCASTFRPAIFRVSSRGACAQSCARLPICCSVAPPLTAR